MSEVDAPFVVQSFRQDRWENYRAFDTLSAAAEAMRQNDRIRDVPWRVVDARGEVRLVGREIVPLWRLPGGHGGEE